MSYSSLAQAMINYVECHLESFDMTQMSETFGFSESYLRELFSKHVNMPIMQYYRKRRIRKQHHVPDLHKGGVRISGR